MRSGFTLVELLVVIGIIVIMLGLGILAFNALTGRRSTAMARNQVAAMLGKARAIALNDQSVSAVSYGVIFFRDPESERTAMMIARRDDTGGGDPDPYDNYKAWTIGVNYQSGDRVVAIVRDDVEAAGTAVRFRCTVANTATTANRPPAFRPAGTSPPLGNGYWEEGLEPGITFPDEPIEYLPVGVSVQLITDPGTIADRYVRFGAIFFDRRGQLDHLGFTLAPGSPPGIRMGLNDGIPASGVLGTLYSAVGVAIYDSQAFSAVASNSEDDFSPLAHIPGHPYPAAADETNEEIWIDNNANLLMIDHYSGEFTQVR